MADLNLSEFLAYKQALGELENELSRLCNSIHAIDNNRLKITAKELRDIVGELKGLSLVMLIPTYAGGPKARSEHESLHSHSTAFHTTRRDSKESYLSNSDAELSHQNRLVMTYLRRLPLSLGMLYGVLRDIDVEGSEHKYSAILLLQDEIIVLLETLELFGSNCVSKHFMNTSQRFIYSQCNEVSNSVKTFRETGSEEYKASQKRETNTQFSAATVGTLLGGISAATLQFSKDRNITRLEVVTNTLWIISLATSVGSALNSLTALAWKHSPAFRNRTGLDRWAFMWIRNGSLALLVGSAATFSAGLICFTLQTQSELSFWLLLGATCIFNLGMLVAVIWRIKHSSAMYFSRHGARQNDNQENVMKDVQNQRRKRYRQKQYLRRRTNSEQNPARNKFIPNFMRTIGSLYLLFPTDEVAVIGTSIKTMFGKAVRYSKEMTIYIGRNAARAVTHVIRFMTRTHIDSAGELPASPRSLQLYHDISRPNRDVENADALRYSRSVFRRVLNVTRAANQFRDSTRPSRYRTLPGDQTVRHLQFSPDGKRLAVIGETASFLFLVGEDLSLRRFQRWNNPITRSSRIEIVWAYSCQALFVMYCPRSFTEHFAVQYISNFSEDETIAESKLHVITEWMSLWGGGDFESRPDLFVEKAKGRDLLELSAQNRYDMERMELCDSDSAREPPSLTWVAPGGRQLLCCKRSAFLVRRSIRTRWSIRNRSHRQWIYAINVQDARSVTISPDDLNRQTSWKNQTFIPLRGTVQDVAFLPCETAGDNESYISVSGPHSHRFLISYYDQPPEEWLYTVSRDSVQQDRAEMSHCFQLPPALLSGDDLRTARFGVSTFIGFNNSQVLIPVNGRVLICSKETDGLHFHEIYEGAHLRHNHPFHIAWNHSSEQSAPMFACATRSNVELCEVPQGMVKIAQSGGLNRSPLTYVRRYGATSWHSILPVSPPVPISTDEGTYELTGELHTSPVEAEGSSI